MLLEIGKKILLHFNYDLCEFILEKDLIIINLLSAKVENIPFDMDVAL